MKITKNVKAFILLDIETKRLLIEAFLFLGRARILKGRPFSKLAPSLGERDQETSFIPDPTHLKILKNTAHAIQIMSCHTLWESQCLVKAIAAMKMLERRGIDSTLYLGTAKDETGKMVAHAWLRSGPFYITGGKGKEKFTVVGIFAKQIG